MKTLLISMSDHYTFQETTINLAKFCSSEHNEFFTITSKNIIYKHLSNSHNFYIKISKKGYNILGLFKLIKLIRKIGPSIIIFINPHPWNFIISLLFKGKLTIVNIIHDVIPHKGDKNEKKVYIYNKYTGRISDYIIVHSKMFVNLFSSIYKVDLKKIFHIDLFREYIDYSEFVQTNTCLLFGRINKYKGLNNLDYVITQCPELKFLIVGQVDKTSFDDIKRISRHSNVEIVNKKITEDEMSEYFTKSEIIILPYENATQSGVIVDAYKYSRPVICFEEGGLVEQVLHQKTGYLIPNQNLNLFSDQLKNFFQLSINDKKKLSFNSWKFGYMKYSFQKSNERVNNLVKNFKR